MLNHLRVQISYTLVEIESNSGRFIYGLIYKVHIPSNLEKKNIYIYIYQNPSHSLIFIYLSNSGTYFC